MIPIPPKTVVLTFDDAVKSHRTFVGPMLRELGFQATFFVTHQWMADTANFMNWNDIAELHQMGFEIGNHTWSHMSCSTSLAASRLEGELALIENRLAAVKVPKPTSFAWPGNGFGPEAVAVLKRLGMKLARRGGMPEVDYGRATVGPAFVPDRRHRLLIPTTGDSYPVWTFEHFVNVVNTTAIAGQAAVLQFHGVPDVAHPWVHTEPGLFERYMRYLKDNGFRVIALRDLEPYAGEPDDPVLAYRHPLREDKSLPVEVAATRKRLDYWRSVMAAHGYSAKEASTVTGLEEREGAAKATGRILPYPGGRHPRIGFLDGAVSPMRGTKASLFLPWDRSSYIVIDVPEAIFSNKGLHFLAHTHIPTVWDDQHKVIPNVDWVQEGEGLRLEWALPDGLTFGSRVQPMADGGADLKLWLRNGTPEKLTRLRAQVCIMLARARGFEAQTRDNKELTATRASVTGGGHRISVEFDRVQRVWANPPCPCMHSDPSFPDCEPGETVTARGRVGVG